MKIRALSILILGLITLLSCSNDTDDIEQDSRVRILVENSPWAFQDYKLISVIERNNSKLTEEELENFIEKSITGATLSFNADGTGQSKSGTSDVTNTWTWTLNKNEIQSIWDNPEGTMTTWTNVEISSTQFKFEEDALNFIDEEGNNIKWHGTYTCN